VKKEMGLGHPESGFGIREMERWEADKENKSFLKPDA
jgi:hypothetical protein